MRQKVWFFDLLRCVAAVAVVGIHVLGPYREQLGEIPDGEWVTAISFNSFSRWAVPVFIMITGALMLSDTRDFDARYYVKRRLGKVLLPFLVWSAFYALLSGFTLAGFDSSVALQTLQAFPGHETYYHLGFFLLLYSFVFHHSVAQHVCAKSQSWQCYWPDLRVVSTNYLVLVEG